MAKLTLSFKGHLIAIHHLGEGGATIGRDLDCAIPIDSLAVAPRHAQILAHADGYSITAIDPDHPVIVNSEKVEQAPLHHGDLIRIGKHTLHYAEAAQEVAIMPAAGAADPGRGPGRADRFNRVCARSRLCPDPERQGTRAHPGLCTTAASG